jgi:serpin B
MKWSLIGALVLAIISAGSEVELTPVDGEQAALTLVAGNNEFALGLYSEVCDMQESDNIFFSPYSISMALGMAYSGARGQTALDIASVLHFNLPVQVVNRTFQSVTEMISLGSMPEMVTGDPFTMAISNGLWVQEGYEILENFVSSASGSYGAPAKNLDFSGDAEGSREIINTWVAENTMNRILNLLPAGVLSADTRVVLTNAVYFKASWRYPFNENATSDGRFILEDDSAVVVPMMTNTEHYTYACTDEWSAVSLDYAGGDASMLVILPSGSMEEFQEQFDTDLLQNIRGSLTSRNVQLSMPRFEFTRSMLLSQILSTLGMESAFGSSADFSGITGNLDLYISEVLHKAYIKVDENGTEAAAATAIMMSLVSMPEEPVEININKPFVFIIQNNHTGSIVFMGRMMNPTV